MGRVQGHKALILMTKGEKNMKVDEKFLICIFRIENHKKQVLVIICVIMRDGRGSCHQKNATYSVNFRPKVSAG